MQALLKFFSLFFAAAFTLSFFYAARCLLLFFVWLFLFLFTEYAAMYKVPDTQLTDL